MLLKIYLAISIITSIMMVLMAFSVRDTLESRIKNGELDIDKNKCSKSNAGLILAVLRMVILSFIPVFNIVIFITLVFRSKEVEGSIMKNLNIELKK